MDKRMASLSRECCRNLQSALTPNNQSLTISLKKSEYSVQCGLLHFGKHYFLHCYSELVYILILLIQRLGLKATTSG